MVGDYDQLYPHVKAFIQDHLFTNSVDLDDPVILRNLSEPEVSKVIHSRPFRTEPRGFVPAKRSVFNRIVGEGSGEVAALKWHQVDFEAEVITVGKAKPRAEPAGKYP